MYSLFISFETVSVGFHAVMDGNVTRNADEILQFNVTRSNVGIGNVHILSIIVLSLKPDDDSVLASISQMQYMMKNSCLNF